MYFIRGKLDPSIQSKWFKAEALDPWMAIGPHHGEVG